MRMRALGFGEILDEIFRFYRRNFWLLVLLSLAPVLPTLVLEKMPFVMQVLFFGALLSAIKSTASATLLAPSVTFTENIWRQFRPRQGDKAGPIAG